MFLGYFFIFCLKKLAPKLGRKSTLRYDNESKKSREYLSSLLTNQYIIIGLSLLLHQYFQAVQRMLGLLLLQYCRLLAS